jgi:hypothetical protein
MVVVCEWFFELSVFLLTLQEKTFANNDKAKAYAARVIQNKKSQGYKDGAASRRRASELLEAGTYPKLSKAILVAKKTAKAAVKKAGTKKSALKKSVVKKSTVKKSTVKKSATKKSVAAVSKGVVRKVAGGVVKKTAAKPKRVTATQAASSVGLTRKATVPGTHTPGIVDKACSITNGTVLKVGLVMMYVD